MSARVNSTIVEERLSSLFQPDSLLSDQFQETHQRNTPLEPEKRLMMAMLEDAVACYQKYVSAEKPKEKALFNEVEEWFWEKESDWFFSFENVSECLGLDPDYIRKGLTHWREAQSRPKAKIYHLNPGVGRTNVFLRLSDPMHRKRRNLKSGTK